MGLLRRAVVVAIALAVVPLLPLPSAEAEGTAWTTPIRIAQGVEGTYSNPSLAVDPGGDAAVAWTQDTNDSRVLALSRYDPQQGWTQPAALHEIGSVRGEVLIHRWEAYVGLDSSGGAFLVYLQLNESALHAMNHHREDGWLDDRSMGPVECTVFECALLAINQEGVGVAAWPYVNRTGPWYSEIWATTKGARDAWTYPILLARDLIAGPLPVSLDIDGEGNAMLLWQFSRDLYSSRFGAGFGWEEPVRMTGNYSLNPTDLVSMEMDVDSEGSAVMAWSEQIIELSDLGGFGNLTYTLKARHFEPESGWDEAVEVAELPPGMTFVNEYGFREHAGYFPRVSVAQAPSGRSMVLWEQGVNQSELWASEFEPGAGWGNRVLLRTSKLGVPSPSLAASASGDFLATWVELNETFQGFTSEVNESLWGARFIPGVGWSAPSIIVTREDRFLVSKGETDGRGRGFAAWIVPEGPDHGLWVSQLPPREESPFLLYLLLAGAGGGVLVAAAVYLYWRRRSATPESQEGQGPR